MAEKILEDSLAEYLMLEDNKDKLQFIQGDPN